MTENGLDQPAVAVKLGVTQQAVSLWLKGQTPRAARVRQIEAMMRGEPLPPAVEPKARPSYVMGTPEERAKARLAKEIQHAQEILANAPKIEAEYLAKEKAREEERQREREQRRAARFQQISSAADEFVMALPEGLTQYTHATTHFEGLPWRCDYLSSRVCAILLINVDDFFLPGIEWPVLELAALRAVHHTESSTPPSHYLLAVVNAEEEGDTASARRMRALCKALGVEVAYLPDPTAAAAKVADLEYGPL